METQQAVNYQRIAKAIEFIRANHKNRPSLDEIAVHVNLSPFHFQRLFTEWAAVSPKQFISFLSLGYAKEIMKKKELSLFDVAGHVGLSGTGRLHDLFVKIEGMTPGEYRNGGEDLNINFTFSQNLFGKLLVASTPKGVCHMAFGDDENKALGDLKTAFPNATFTERSDDLQSRALGIFGKNNRTEEIRIHLKGTDFQLKVWECLLRIPAGELRSYGEVAKQIRSPKASRAVGSAVGDNPVAYIIPCHRVIQSGGEYGQYRWGSTRKSAMIGWEASQVVQTKHHENY